MNFETTLVVLDTCVLLPPRVSDVLMDLRKERIFSAHWTSDIDDEYLRNMQKLFSIPEEKARRRLSAMKKRCPEWEIFATCEDFERVPEKVDEKDCHVAAAALALRHAAQQIAEEGQSEDVVDVILLTENVKDMAEKPMGKLGVRVMRIGQFLNEAYAADPDAVKRAISQAARELKNPPYTVVELLHVLKKLGATELVSGISRDMEIAPDAPSAVASPS